MRKFLKKKEKAIAMFITLWLSLGLISAFAILADTGQRSDTPTVNIRHEHVGEHGGNQIHRMVVSTSAPGGFSLFGIVISYDNSVIFPVHHRTHENVAPPSNTAVISGTGVPFSLLASPCDEDSPAFQTLNAWLAQSARTGFSFDVLTIGDGVTTNAPTDVFAFYYRIEGTMTDTTFRVEDGRQSDSMVGTTVQTSFIRPGIMIMSGSVTHMWGPHRADLTYTVMPDSNIVISGEIYNPQPTPPPELPPTPPPELPPTPPPTYETPTPPPTPPPEQTPTPPPTATPTPTVTPPPTTPTPPLPSLTVTFATAGGTLPSDTPPTISGPPGFTIPSFPTPTRTGYTFNGWLLNGALIVPPLTVNQNITLQASWTPVTATPMPNLVVTLATAGGALPGGTPYTFTGQPGFSIATLPTPTRAGHTFNGWARDGVLVTVPLTVNQSMTLQATWTAVVVTPSPSPSPSPTPTPVPGHTVVFLPGAYGNFPSGETGIRIIPGGTQIIIAQTPVPTRAGHTFAGWRLNNANVTFPLTVNGDLSLTAAWTVLHDGPAGGTGGGGSGGGTLVNPQTSPIRISFMIFGAVMLTGIAAFGLINATKKHMAKASQYEKDLTRHNREKRITDMMDGK